VEGPARAWIAGAVLAPDAGCSLMLRFNNPERCWYCCLIVAAYHCVRRDERRDTRWKRWQAETSASIPHEDCWGGGMKEFCSPGFALVVLVSGDRRDLDATFGSCSWGVRMVLSGGLDVARFSLWAGPIPRPYIAGSTDQPLLQLAWGQRD